MHYGYCSASRPLPKSPPFYNPANLNLQALVSSTHHSTCCAVASRHSIAQIRGQNLGPDKAPLDQTKQCKHPDTPSQRVPKCSKACDTKNIVTDATKIFQTSTPVLTT